MYKKDQDFWYCLERKIPSFDHRNTVKSSDKTMKLVHWLLEKIVVFKVHLGTCNFPSWNSDNPLALHTEFMSFCYSLFQISGLC